MSTNNTADIIAVLEALKPHIKAIAAEQTASCVRSKKMDVTAAPNGSVIGVQEAFGSEIQIPYSSALSGAAVGSSVRVVWFDNDMSTAVALYPGKVV